ncbi:SMI1/KNR4 family protein [Pseudomonas sp. CC120222-01a]|uniref:SMI1/KNR4 family protein n=1 Tax=Pseudomonas sp. CC120222-01a TaxID=1378075 RepID=UPI000D9E5C4B|nr:SMI1/KNR4 family protein [Pseudomonas sp. CC120222-01a]PVZ37267.1 SUKH superfamily protein [Pseudomonas sp. CC120222-01a]
MLDLEESESSIDMGDFSQIELLAGGKLPPLFKRIYLKNNGGFPEATEVEGDEYVFSINGFNPIKFGKLPIEKLMQEYTDQDSDLEGYVPFAYDDGGNSFMLSLKKEDDGVVYLWIQGEMRLEKVCSSFDGFINSLRVG